MNAPVPVSPTAHPLDPRSWEVTRPDRASRALSLVLALVAAAAVYGGVGLVTDRIGMTAQWLDGTPFTSWTLPGVALLAGVALPQAVAAGMAVAAHRWAAAAGILAGIGLVLWIAVQLVVLGRFFWLQPVVVLFGLAEIALASWWSGHDGTA
ncbi:MAG: hypothetical protein HY830_10050 [Actinobacteria bacterium]|nr:hypothetical protein [Actinomycetota bacterium]